MIQYLLGALKVLEGRDWDGLHVVWIQITTRRVYVRYALRVWLTGCPAGSLGAVHDGQTLERQGEPPAGDQRDSRYVQGTALPYMGSLVTSLTCSVLTMYHIACREAGTVYCLLSYLTACSLQLTRSVRRTAEYGVM